jgi:hypothetical protein
MKNLVAKISIEYSKLLKREVKPLLIMKNLVAKISIEYSTLLKRSETSLIMKNYSMEILATKFFIIREVSLFFSRI